MEKKCGEEQASVFLSKFVERAVEMLACRKLKMTQTGYCYILTTDVLL